MVYQGDTVMELVTFSIPAFRKTDIAARLEKLARKAVKNGNPDITYSFGDTFIREVETEHGKRLVDFIEITVSGEAPRISGWDFLARVELLGEENLVHRVPGGSKELEGRFRTHDGFCDHCNSARRRNDVFVLANDEKQIAVGRQCLREFLGVDDPKKIVARAQFFEELKNVSDEDSLGNLGSWDYVDLREVLVLAAANIRLKGYVSKAKQEQTGLPTTGQVVAWGLSGVPAYVVKEITKEDRDWAEKTVNFFRCDDSFDNEYMDNIRVLMKQDIIKKNHIALISSAVITAQRELAPKAEVKESNFVGEVKSRLKDVSLLLEKIIYLGSGSFGPSYLHLMKDADGNAFSWITGNKVQKAEGTTLTVDATVKEHKVYKGTKQTVLTRTKVKA
jgi:hypothetical protein